MLIGEIASWITNHTGNWSTTGVERARFAILDTVGCMIAAHDHEIVLRTAKSCLSHCEGKASAVAKGQSGSASPVALVNGTAAHVLEIDDNFYPALTHASAQAVPALLALAQEHNCSGRQVLNGYLYSLEIQAAIASAMDRVHTLSGWHATGTITTISTAAAAAHMLGLQKTEIGNAMSIACSMAAGTKAQFGTMAKSLHCGLAARNSVEAALLAAAGIEGATDALDGPYGFLAMHNGGETPNYESVMKCLDTSNAIDTFGLAPKRHACCASAHKGLDAIEDLQKTHAFSLDDIERIDVSIGTTNRQNLRYDRPEDGMEARFSLPYAMIVFLSGGKFWIDDLEDDAVHRPAIQSHLGKVHVHVLDLDEKSLPIAQPVMHQVAVQFKNGQQLCRARAYAKGTISDPFSEDDYKNKFLRCCVGSLGTQETGRLWSLLRMIDREDTLEGLLSAGSQFRQVASLNSR